jgi:hypothetical protein
MADPIDPRLYASSVPPRHQPYPAQPPNNAGHPYYLSTPTHQQVPHVSQAPLGAALDPALEQTSPRGPDGSPEEEHEDDGDHNRYVMKETKQKRPSRLVEESS